MNRYGHQAQEHWRTHLPVQYAAIPDPETHFSTLGEEAAQQIEDLSEKLAGPDQPGESYLDKLGRLNMARQQAEEIVLGEQVLAAPERTQPELEEELAVDQEDPQELQDSSIRTDWIPVDQDPPTPYASSTDPQA